MLRFLTAGESHGKVLMAFLEGLPAGIAIDVLQLNQELARRQRGYGRSNRQKLEKDEAQIISGIRHGVTTGAPIALTINNKDAENWRYVMSVDNIDLSSAEAKEQLDQKSIKRFRPGHADLSGTIKYRQKDIRDVLERASARETASRTAVGALCQQFLKQLDVNIAAHVVQIGHISSSLNVDDMDLTKLSQTADQSELFCVDKSADQKMTELIQQKWQEGDTLGGVIEIRASGLPIGLGSYTQWDRRLDGKLAQAMLSIQAMKAIEIGEGVANAAKPGSQVHDALYPSESQSSCVNTVPFRRTTNKAGGLEGGMTNGEQVIVRAYMKPIPTLRAGLDSVSFPAFKAERAHYERSDVCAVPAAAVVCKAMVSFVLAEAMLDKFAGDSLSDVVSALSEFRKYCRNLNGAVKAP